MKKISIKELFQKSIELSVSFVNPTRSERLTENANKRFKKNKAVTNRDKIEQSLRVLKDNDFVCFSPVDDELFFVQFRKDRYYFVFDYPFSVIDKRSRLLHRMDYVLYKLKFTNKLSLVKQICDNWRGYYCYERNNYGNALTCYCGPDVKLGTELAAMVFKEVYQLPEDFEMNIEFDSWKKYWI